MTAPSCATAPMVLALLWLGYQPAPRYLVTERPIDVGLGIALCIAVDRADAQGIWWWMPGDSGCETRSSGPIVIHADEATVSRLSSLASTALSFRVGTHSAERPFIDVRLVVENVTMRAIESGARVPLQRRPNLDILELVGRRP